jgi:AraC-like DNA-binding protein
MVCASTSQLDSLLQLNDQDLFFIMEDDSSEMNVKQLVGKILLNRTIHSEYSKTKEVYGRVINATFYTEFSASNLDSLIKFSKVANDRETTARSYMKKADFHYNLYQNKIAQENLDLANRYCDKKNSLLKLRIDHLSALLKNYVNEEEEALAIFKKNLEFFNQKDFKTKHSYFYVLTLVSFAESLSRNDQYEESINISELGIKESIRLEELEHYPYFLIVNSSSKVKLKKYDEAIVSLKEGIPQIKNKQTYVSSLSVLIKAYLGKEDIESAENLMIKTDSLFAKDSTLIYYVRIAYGYMSDYYNRVSDNKNELLYIRKIIKLDSIINRSDQELSKAVARSETKQKTRSLNYSSIAIAAAVLIMFIYLTVFYKAIQLKKHEPKTKINLIPKSDLDEKIYNTILNGLIKFELEKQYLIEGCSMVTLAKELNTNTTYLSKVINKNKQKNFTRYISEMRINYCLNKLKTDDSWSLLTLEAIAKNCGFKNYRSFSSSFLKQTGKLPSEFIKNLM